MMQVSSKVAIANGNKRQWDVVDLVSSEEEDEVRMNIDTNSRPKLESNRSDCYCFLLSELLVVGYEGREKEVLGYWVRSVLWLNLIFDYAIH